MDADRYLRLQAIEGLDLDAVRAMRFAVIGAGAVGNEVVKNLVLFGVRAIDVFDFDTIEVHNLTRAVLFRDEDVGRRKAVVAVERAMGLDPAVRLRAFHGDFWDTLSLRDLKRYDAAICCVDSFESRIRLNTMCLVAGVDLIETAIDSRLASVALFPLSSAGPVPCYECGLPEAVYSNVSARYSCGWLRRASFEERKVPTTIVTSSVAGALATSLALGPARGGTGPAGRTARRILVDTVGGTSTVSQPIRRADCVACSGRTQRPVVLSVRRVLDESLLPGGRDAADGLRDLPLTCSDRIITERWCAVCDPEDSERQRVFERAADRDDRYLVCERCGQASIQLTVRDSFRAGELIDGYAGRAMPAKFVEFELSGQPYAIEFEEEFAPCPTPS
jgi:molybdopterin/thiamine biosynthesis adenylyltransferase